MNTKKDAVQKAMEILRSAGIDVGIMPMYHSKADVAIGLRGVDIKEIRSVESAPQSTKEPGKPS